MTAPTTFLATGTYYKADGITPATGNVVFTPNDREVSGVNIVGGGSVVAVLVNGVLSQSLVANENGYFVTENLDGGMPVNYVLPGSLAGTIDLRTYGPT